MRAAADARSRWRGIVSSSDSSVLDIRDRLLSIFEQTRQSPGARYEPERLLAFLTEPPEPKGRRVADTFAGRRRFVRFMNAVQLHTGVCFTLEDWERGFGLDDLAKVVMAKAARPDHGLRLAEASTRPGQDHENQRVPRVACVQLL